jgi:hypothetical protein
MGTSPAMTEETSGDGRSLVLRRRRADGDTDQE